MNNPYDPTEKGPGYYGSIPEPPPPPEWTPKRHKRPWSVFALIAVIVFAMGFLMTMGGLLYVSSHHASVEPTPDMSYTAKDILSDFEKEGCKCGYAATYATSIFEWSGGNFPVGIEPASSASWPDPSAMPGAASIGLWIYHSIADTQTAYNQVAADEMSPNVTWPESMNPTEYLRGRCLLLITGYASATTPPPWSGYQQALNKYCI